MALIDVVQWDPKSNDIFAYKYPHSNLSTKTQLIVRDSQEAVFVSKGMILGKFGPGKYTLSTENLPFLRNLYGIPFGGKNPFTAEVWFVNKTVNLHMDWETATIRIKDADYHQQLPLIVRGRYGLQVKDTEKFLVQLVGSQRSYSAEDLTDHFRGALISETTSSISSFMNVNGIGINQIAAHLSELSDHLCERLSGFWSDYGFLLKELNITSVDLDVSTPEGKMISEAIAQSTAQGIAGYTWQQDQAFKTMQMAADKGSAGGILITGFLSRLLSSAGGGVNPIMQPPVQNEEKRAVYVRKEWYCSVCEKKHPVTSLFCDHCGHRYRPCSLCGMDNPEQSEKCINCGHPMASNSVLASAYCSKCNAEIKPGQKFCPRCGASV